MTFRLIRLPRSASKAHKAKLTHSSKSTWHHSDKNTIPGNPGVFHDEWRSDRPPFGPFDKIKLHRIYKKKSLKTRLRKNNNVVFLIPGAWNAGGWSKIVHPDLSPILFLAHKGYDVYTLDFRVRSLPTTGYAALRENGFDFSQFADWNYTMFREDIKSCVEKIKNVSGIKKIFMAGFSNGGMLMFRYASIYQSDLKGLISLDGYVKNSPAGPKLNEETFNHLVELLREGKLPCKGGGNPVIRQKPGTYLPTLLDVSPETYETWQFAGIVPQSGFMVGKQLPEGFKSVSEFVANDAHFIWGPAILANYHDGNIAQDLLVSSLSGFTRYWPMVQYLELGQLLAWDKVPYFEYGEPIKLPTIAFLSPLTSPPDTKHMHHLPNFSESSDVEVVYLPEYGHMDILYGTNALADIKEKLINWLERH